MKYAIEMGSGAKFHKNWFRHSKYDGGYTNTQTEWRLHKPTCISFFFQIKKSKVISR
jgi:hypothetical protein